MGLPQLNAAGSPLKGSVQGCFDLPLTSRPTAVWEKPEEGSRSGLVRRSPTESFGAPSPLFEDRDCEAILVEWQLGTADFFGIVGKSVVML